VSLLVKVETAMRRHQIPASTFGRKAAGDPRLVSNLREGRAVGDKLRDQVLGFIAGLDAGPAGNETGERL